MSTQFFSKQQWTPPPYWKMAVMRVALYAGMAGGNTFLAGVADYQDWSDISPMSKMKLYVNILLAVASAWGAFLDQTITKMGGDPMTPEKIKSILTDMNQQTKTP